MPTRKPRRPRLPPGWRLDRQGEQIYRLWRTGAARPAGVIAAGYNSWTSRPFGPELAAEYATVEARMGHRFRQDLSMADVVELARSTTGLTKAEGWAA